MVRVALWPAVPCPWPLVRWPDSAIMSCRCDQLHPALGTAVGLLADHLGMHRARKGGRALRAAHVHLGDKCERLVRRRGEIGLDALPLARPCPSYRAEPRTARAMTAAQLAAHRDAGESIRRSGVRCRASLRRAPRTGRPRRTAPTAPARRRPRTAPARSGRCHHRRASAAPPVQRHLEDAGVRGVRQVEAHNLAGLRRQRQLGLAATSRTFPKRPIAT